MDNFRRRTVVLIFAVLTVVIGSCNKQRSYPYRIVNNTNYDITTVSFSGTVSGDSHSINAHDTTENKIFAYDKKVRISPKLMCLTIGDFVGASNFNVIYSRPCAPFSKKDLNEDLNTIVITSTESADTITFEISIN